METNTTKRPREKSFKTETSTEVRNKIRSKITEIQHTKEGLNNTFLWDILGSESDFIGVIPQDYLSSLRIINFPATLVVNLDLSTQPGSHWIALSISKDTLEIYDSLALNKQYWQHHPKFLLAFINQFHKTHRILVTPMLQNPISNLCGFYCIYFIICRRVLSFSSCLSIFTSNLKVNDDVLINLLTQ